METNEHLVNWPHDASKSFNAYNTIFLSVNNQQGQIFLKETIEEENDSVFESLGNYKNKFLC